MQAWANHFLVAAKEDSELALTAKSAAVDFHTPDIYPEGTSRQMSRCSETEVHVKGKVQRLPQKSTLSGT